MVIVVISKKISEKRDTQGSDTQGSEYDWSNGLAIALGEQDGEYSVSVLGESRGWEGGYSCGRDFTECELSESRGREGGYSCDRDFSECELSEESARGREGGSSSGCEQVITPLLKSRWSMIIKLVLTTFPSSYNGLTIRRDCITSMVKSWRCIMMKLIKLTTFPSTQKCMNFCEFLR